MKTGEWHHEIGNVRIDIQIGFCVLFRAYPKSHSLTFWAPRNAEISANAEISPMSTNDSALWNRLYEYNQETQNVGARFLSVLPQKPCTLFSDNYAQHAYLSENRLFGFPYLKTTHAGAGMFTEHVISYPPFSAARYAATVPSS